MPTKRTDIKPDISAVVDRGEKIMRLEPLRLGETSRHRGELTDLAIDLAARSAGFHRSLPVGIHSALADMVRSMNCYYSNTLRSAQALCRVFSRDWNRLTAAWDGRSRFSPSQALTIACCGSIRFSMATGASRD